jgi:hypothetical protein
VLGRLRGGVRPRLRFVLVQPIEDPVSGERLCGHCDAWHRAGGGGDALAGLLEVVQGTLDLRDRTARLLEYRDGHLLLHEREVKVQRQIVRLQVDRLSHTSARVSQAYGSEGTLRRVARASAYFSASK